MKKIKLLILVAICLATLQGTALAQTSQTQQMQTSMPPELLPPQAFLVGRVVSITNEGQIEQEGVPQITQQARVLIDDGSAYGINTEINYGNNIAIRPDQKLQVGEKVVIVKTSDSQNTYYYIYDKYRLPPMYLLVALFFGLAILFGRLKGFTSILGLFAGIIILIKFIVPSIISGGNPLLASLIGSLFILVISLYLSHGINTRTTLALISSLTTMVIAVVCSIIFVNLTKLTGIGSDTSMYLQFGPLEKLNLKGLLLGGIIIGAIGVLDDVTTGQTAAVDEISKANPRLTFKDLYKSGISVGREHIASLVNTLALAYAGASLPLFLIFNSDTAVPLWVSVNSESIVEEIVRTLVGSTALIFAVPISTLLAAWYYSQKRHHKKTT